VIIFFLSLLNLTFFIDNRRLLLSTAGMVISQKRFQVIFQSVPSAIFIFDRTTGKTMAANDFASQWLGYTKKEFPGLTLRDIALSSAGEERNSQYQKKDGTIVDVEEIRSIITLEDRENLLVIAHDITERKMAAEQIGLAKEFSDSIVRTAKALIIGLDREGKIVLFNDHAEEITGWRREDALGRDWFSHFLPERLALETKQMFARSLQRYDPKEQENRIITKAGVERIIAWNNTILRDGKGDVYMVLITGIDVTERKRTEELLKHMSQMDGLTGIANRRHFDDFLLREWKRASREGAPLSLIMCDIDFFKGYNDSEGHQQGDICLQKVATALTTSLKRPLDFVARYGGEEFVVVLPNTKEGGAAKIAETMRKNVDNLGIPHTESQAGRVVTISLGVATARTFPNSSPDKLIAAADKALFRAKTAGRNRVAVSDSI
jgi:diguanylate cyclase (GGDEF)-like protein/PAS domain S-box-containing protein